MFNILFGLGRVYKKLPRPRNAKELGDNLEVLTDYFLDRGCRKVMGGGSVTWEWRLGMELKEVVGMLRAFIDEDTYTLHFREDRRRSAGS